MIFLMVNLIGIKTQPGSAARKPGLEMDAAFDSSRDYARNELGAL
jgi:hypothetical protein